MTIPTPTPPHDAPWRGPKDVPRGEELAPGSSLCAGCGGLLTLRLFLKALGKPAVVVNGAGCMTLMATYPYTPLKGSWLYTTMSGPAASAQGIRDALDVLRTSQRIAAEDDLEVVVLAGDGSSYDMGLAPTSAAIHRGLDFWYLCYDNEAYGNTGFQLSPSSPFGSETTTSPVDAREPEGTIQQKKDLFEIWRAHRPPYVATLSPHDPVDLDAKICRAKERRGPKLLLALAPCPTGWGFEPELSMELARKAVDCGIWPLEESIDGAVRHTRIPRRRHPVAEYLELQRRFRHLFHPERHETALAAIQARVDAYWERVHSLESGRPV